MQSSMIWMQEAIEVDPNQTFPADQLPRISPKLLKILEQNGFHNLLASQFAVWNLCCAGLNTTNDICLSFPTGSGKTLAYVLPILQKLHQQSSCGIHCLTALIILPTNALLTQVSKVVAPLSRALGLRVGILGISTLSEEAKMLTSTYIYDSHQFDGLVDIVLSTPGRLLTHIDHNSQFSLQTLQYLVLDEADHLIKRRHFDSLPSLIQKIKQDTNAPLSSTVQKFIVSATVSYDIGRLRMLDLHAPRMICPIGGKERRYHFPPSLKHFKLVVPPPLRLLALVGLLHQHQNQKMIIFCATPSISQKLMQLLSAISFLKGRVMECSGDVIEWTVSKALKNFEQREFSILICSDLVSRGMDLADVDWVISYSAPIHAKTYIHRVGRTARIGKVGNSCCLIRKGIDEKQFKELTRKLNVDITDWKLDIEVLKQLKHELDDVLVQMKQMKD